MAWARAGAVDEAVSATAHAVTLARKTGSTWPLSELHRLAASPHLSALADPLKNV